MIRRNKALQLLLLIQLLIVVIVAVLIIRKPQASIWIALIGMGILVGVNFWYSKARYKEMRDLTEYMYLVQQGKEALEIRDNEEGELSILKNEVYKLCVKLTHQAEQLTKEKEFLANSMSDISHQLKTPLTSMMVMTELLEDPLLPEEKRNEFIQNVSHGLSRMEWLIQALLRLAKLDAGASHMKKEDVNAKRILIKALQPFLLAIEKKEIELSVVGEEAASFIGDEEWMVEALSNIIKNGIEHTGKRGNIEIQWEENSLYTSFIIKDTGCGIEKEELPYVFDRFYRGASSSKESVGIGLALSKMIVLQHNGSITCESEKGVGTTFVIKIYRK